MKAFSSSASLVLLVLVGAASAQLSTNNAAFACVEYGDCTTLGQNTFRTATQFAPVTPPAFTPGLATIINPLSDSVYLSSLAVAGGSQAFNNNQGGVSSGGQQTQVSQQQAQGGSAQPTSQLQIDLGPSTTAAANSNLNINAAARSGLSVASSLLVMGAGAMAGAVFVL